MPPIYDWQDKKTGKTATVVRHFTKYEDIPERAEAPELTDEEYAAAEWERIIGSNIQVRRGMNWNGAKGYWIQLLTAGVSLWNLL